MTKLRISDDLSLPLDWMTLSSVVYGARGSGKTTLGSVIAEEVTKAKQRFCAIDLKGDWYGLKSSADGKSAGIPVVVFGGDHQDVPLEEGAGAFIAETIAQLEQPAILDLEYLSKGKQVRFLAAFFERLYDRNRDPLLLLLDEAQRYAPQKPFDPDAAKCLGAVEDIVKLGRKHGIGPHLFTQRGSGLNKEVSELCDMMIAFRTPGPLDQDRVKGWLEANVTREQQQAVMSSLSGLPTGTAVFASGHPDLKIFGTYAVRRRETFDSSATPKVGQRRKEPKQLAKPDLEDLRKRMADAIERQKADDPKALRAQLGSQRMVIAELEKKLNAALKVVTVKAEIREMPVLKNGALKNLTKAVSGLQLLATRAEKHAELIRNEAQAWWGVAVALRETVAPVVGELRRIQSAPTGVAAATGTAVAAPVRAAASRPVPATAAMTRQPGERPNLPVGQPTHHAGGPAARTEGAPRRYLQKVLDATASLHALGYPRPSLLAVATWSKMSVRGGAFMGYLRELAAAGMVEKTGGEAWLTAAGQEAANPRTAMTTADVHAVAHEIARPYLHKVLDPLLLVYPQDLDLADLALRAGMSVEGGAFAGYVRELRAYGFVTTTKGSARAADVLFPEGLS